jgi:hypothetical protein
MLVGADINVNGTLETNEVQAQVPIWHGNDGIAGTDGINGLNGANGTLVTISEDGYWVLNGLVTEFRALGIDGQDGTNGANGTDGHSPYIGEDGYWYVWDVELNIFVTTNLKAQGENGTNGSNGVDGVTPNIYFLTQNITPTLGHYNGGVLVTMIWDKNDDQEIDEEDILGGYTVWHGNDGANGSNGSDGATPYIDEEGYWWIGDYFTGVNAYGIDGKDGVDGQNGIDGIDGFSPYISETGYWVVMIDGQEVVTPYSATGPQGPKGDKGDKGETIGYTVSTAQNCNGVSGYRVTIDTDPAQSFEVCDGKVGPQGLTGFQYLARTTKKVNGCFDVEFGLDINRNDVLDDEEVNDLQTQTVCDGLSTLIETSAKVDGCFTVTTGLDENRNGVIDLGEEISSTEICDGVSSTISVSEKDENTGCVTITTWTDYNLNGSDDAGETSTSVICDGIDGESGSVVTVTENGTCVDIKTWLDLNGDGIETADETNTETVCDGAKGDKGDQGIQGEAGVCECDFECPDGYNLEVSNLLYEGFNNNTFPNDWSKLGSGTYYDYYNGNGGSMIARAEAEFSSPTFTPSIGGQVRMTAKEKYCYYDKDVEAFAYVVGGWVSLGIQEINGSSSYDDYVWNLPNGTTNVKFELTANTNDHNYRKIYIDKIVVRGVVLECDTPQ